MNMYNIRYDDTINNEELIIIARNGDNDAKELLFKNNIPFVYKLARRWISLGSKERLEELMSIGFVGLTKAYNKYEFDKGCKFIGYVKKLVWNEFIDFTEYTNREKFTKYNVTSLDDKCRRRKRFLHQMIASELFEKEYNNILDRIIISDLRTIVEKVASPKEKDLFKKHYFKDMSLSDIAREEGTCRAAPSRLHRQLILKIRSQLDERTVS